jgi:histidinol-phosphatase
VPGEGKASGIGTSGEEERVEKILEVAIEAAREAGAVALKYYESGFDVTLKPDRTPVTQADREAEEAIVRVLGRAGLEFGFLGEEFGARGSQESRWIIDPIDGTKNFVRKIPLWATLIGLEERGEVTLGVIHNPVTGELLYARKGAGAFSNGERIRVSSIGSLEEAFLCHASLHLIREAGYWDGFVRLVDETERQRGFGEYLSYALVARGQAEIAVEADLKPWDLAPIKILIEEAGGRFTDFEGKASIYGGSALATNGRLHEAALELLRSR